MVWIKKQMWTGTAKVLILILMSLFEFCVLYVLWILNQVCCSGFLFTKKPHHHCCEGRYLSLSNSSNPVCCNGQLVPALPNHRCCGGYFVHVETSQCQTASHLHEKSSFLLHRSSPCCSSVSFICPCLYRWKLLSWPLPGPSLRGAWWQLLWGGPVLHEERPALLQRESPWWLQSPMLWRPDYGWGAGVLWWCSEGGNTFISARWEKEK